MLDISQLLLPALMIVAFVLILRLNLHTDKLGNIVARLGCNQNEIIRFMKNSGANITYIEKEPEDAKSNRADNAATGSPSERANDEHGDDSR